jgi:hypothetical protein
MIRATGRREGSPIPPSSAAWNLPQLNSPRSPMALPGSPYLAARMTHAIMAIRMKMTRESGWCRRPGANHSPPGD